MRSHNSGNIHGENLHIWAVEPKKNHFSKTIINFCKKTTPQLLEHIGLQNTKVGVKTNLGDFPLFVWCMLTLALKCFALMSFDFFLNKGHLTGRNHGYHCWWCHGKDRQLQPISVQTFADLRFHQDLVWWSPDDASNLSQRWTAMAL